MKEKLQNLANSVSSSSLASKLRKKRFKFFLELLTSMPNRTVTILDVGGWEKYWEIQEFVTTGHKIIIVNKEKVDTHYPNVSSIVGDARDLSRFKDRSIDIVFSNSVIEHLGTFKDQQRMADEVRRVGRKYYVQTPSFYFPLELHFLFPFFHWLPKTVRIFLVKHFSLGWYKKCNTDEEAIALTNEIRLLKKSELKHLFPDAAIPTERLFGITKSYIAPNG